jgi:hypothetical protein
VPVLTESERVGMAMSTVFTINHRYPDKETRVPLSFATSLFIISINQAEQWWRRLISILPRADDLDDKQ